MDLWLPGSAEQDLRDNRDNRERQLLAGLLRDGELERWSKELQAFDPNLWMVKASDSSSHVALKPGFYHLLRHNPGSTPNVLCVGHRDGQLVLGSASEPMEFCEPTSAVFEALKRADLWSDRSLREQERRNRKLERARDARVEFERQERSEEIHDRVRAWVSPGVSMSRAGAWTNRKGAPRPNRGGA